MKLALLVQMWLVVDNINDKRFLQNALLFFKNYSSFQVSLFRANSLSTAVCLNQFVFYKTVVVVSGDEPCF